MSGDLPDKLGSPGDDPGLRSTQQLVAGEADHAGAGFEALASGRLVGQTEARGVEQRPAAEIVDEMQAAPLGKSGQVAERGLAGEANNLEVAPMDGHQSRSPLVDGRFVVAHVGSVGRADLDQLGATLGHDIGDTESAADLDRLAARENDPAASAERAEDE